MSSDDYKTRRRKEGDAYLHKDGTVPLDRKNLIGTWEKDDYHLYHFTALGASKPTLSRFFRGEFRAAIAACVRDDK